MVQILQEKLNVFKKQFLHVQIAQINQMEGAEHYILGINDTWICKIAKNETSRGLELEMKLLKHLEGKLTTNIPKVLYYEPLLLVYQKIRGTELTNNLYNALTPSQKKNLAQAIANFLYELHQALPDETIKELGITSSKWPWPPDALLNESTLLEDVELIALFKSFIDQYQKVRSNHRSVLLHNDLTLRNMIVDKSTGNLSGIIDFTDVTFDDPYIDLRLNYTSIPELSEAIAHHYARIISSPIHIHSIYIYYAATEFSRYLQLIQEHKYEDLAQVKKRIVSALSTNH